MKRKIATILIMMVMFGGCAFKNDSDRTKAEGAATGATIGALVGAGVGQVAGGDTKSTLLGAAIGGGVGVAVGYAYGDHVASKKKEFASQEDWLDACIASAEQVNSETEAYNQNLAKQLQEIKKENEVLAGQYKQRTVDKNALQAQKQEIDTTLAQANQKLERARFELETQQVVVKENKQQQASRVGKLDKEIVRLKSAIDDLEDSTTTLASLSASMAV